MTSLETHIAGSTDQLIGGLHFAGRNTASYIIARHATTFHPSSAAAWKPSGVRLMRFNLADVAGWLDGATVRLCFTLTNLGASALTPIVDSPASMFRRMRVIAKCSATIEDVEEYGRTYQLFTELKSSQRRFNDVCESWGGATHTASLDAPIAVDSLAAGASRQVVVTLMSSFLSQGKMLPLSMLPITLEIELDDGDAAFAGSGNSWEITRPRLLADVCDLDQALANSYAKHLLDGKSLPIYLDGLYSLRAAVPAGSSLYSLPIARGFTRLSAVYVTFHDSGKWVNRFYAPLSGAANSTTTDTMQWHLTIGSDRWPTFDAESVQESFYRLRLTQRARGVADTMSISPLAYRNDKFVVAQSFEKAPGSAHSGINTRSGSQLTLQFRNLGGATMVHVILMYEQICNVSAAGVEILD